MHPKFHTFSARGMSHLNQLGPSFPHATSRFTFWGNNVGSRNPTSDRPSATSTILSVPFRGSLTRAMEAPRLAGAR